MLARVALATTMSTTSYEYEEHGVAREESETCPEVWWKASCRRIWERIRSTPESSALKGRRLQSIQGMNTGDSGLAEVKQRRLGFARKLAQE
jgi:hypothetical protein